MCGEEEGKFKRMHIHTHTTLKHKEFARKICNCTDGGTGFRGGEGSFILLYNVIYLELGLYREP